MFNKDEKHAELLTEAIISTSLDKKTIGSIYNAVNGYTGDINFKEGDRVMCNASDYFKAPGIVSASTQKIGECTVIEIEQFKTRPLKVQYLTDDGYNTIWVSLASCSKVPTNALAKPMGKIDLANPS